MSTLPHASLRRAFTVVELLVVVGIVAALIAILMPVLGGVREQANRVKCAANLRSIGQALTMYTQQYAHYPSCEIYDNGRGWALWPIRLRAFLSDEQGVFHCPSQDARCEWKKGAPVGPAIERATADHARFGYSVGEALLSTEATLFSYGYNIWGTMGSHAKNDFQKGLGSYVRLYPLPHDPAGVEVRASRVRRPAEMIAVTDATVDGRWDFAVVPNHTDPRLWPGKIHGGGANVLFCDGHVQWYPRKGLLVTYDAVLPSEAPVRRMWNNNYQPD